MAFLFNPFTGTFDIVNSAPVATNSFETIQVPSGTSPVADSATDVLTLSAGSGITIVGNAATDTITISAATTPPVDFVSYSQFGGF